MEPDSGTTNIRNTASAHWRRWLGPDNRCVVPFTSFSKFNREAGGDIWFALDESRPLAFFAGLWTRWTSVRKVREGATTNDLFGFLTTAPNAEVRAMYPKAMPVILTTVEEVDQDGGPGARRPEAATRPCWSFRVVELIFENSRSGPSRCICSGSRPRWRRPRHQLVPSCVALSTKPDTDARLGRAM